jgi:hypothetical protein
MSNIARYTSGCSFRGELWGCVNGEWEKDEKGTAQRVLERRNIQKRIEEILRLRTTTSSARLYASWLEERFHGLCPFLKYTGNRRRVYVTIDRHRRPDFTDPKNFNKVIEVNGDWWHRNDNPQQTVREYASIGIECLVVAECEVNEHPARVKESVTNFIQGNTTSRIK